MPPNDLAEQIYPDLQQMRAIVTGGATGIGNAIARALAAQGVIVTIADIDQTACSEASAALGRVHHGIAMDVRDRSSVQAATDAAIAAMGGLDICIANAGVSSMRPALELTDGDWNTNLDVNARGVFLTNQIAARHFRDTGSGVIVNTASLAAKVGAAFLAHYSASKFAVLGWTQALARELAAQGIRVNAVCPGFVHTGMQTREVAWEAELRRITGEQVIEEYISQTPLGRLETPEDVAGVVVFLCSGAARFMTGQAINVTGGLYTT